jgi:hypothetical protein
VHVAAAPRNPIILDAALGPHEALDRVCKYEKMGLTIRGVVLDDLLGRNSSPGIIEPSIPDVVWISVAAKLHLELRLHDIGRATAEQRFGVSLPIRMRVVIGALDFDPFLVRPFWPVRVRETCRTKHKVLAVAKSADQVARAMTLRISAFSPTERARTIRGGYWPQV